MQCILEIEFADKSHRIFNHPGRNQCLGSLVVRRCDLMLEGLNGCLETFVVRQVLSQRPDHGVAETSRGALVVLPNKQLSLSLVENPVFSL